MSGRVQRVLPWALAFSCLVFDPSAFADAPKRSVGLLLGLLLLVQMTVQLASVALHRATLCAFAALAFVTLSAAHGSGPRWLLLGNWWLFGALALALSALELRVARWVAARTALLIALGTSLWVLGAWLLGARGMQLHAGQGNPNWAGLLLCAAWPLGASDIGFARRTWLGFGFGLVCAAALALTESRVAWVAACVAWSSVLWRSNLRRQALVHLSFLGVSVALTTFSLAARPRAVRPVAGVSARQAPSELDRSARTSLSGRVWIQRVAFERALSELPWGTGLGGFFPAFLEQQGHLLQDLPPRKANQRFSNATSAHDDWLELLFETGPLAPLLLLGAVVLALRSSEPHPAAALLSISVAALGDSPFHLPAVDVVLALIFAVLPRAPRLTAKRLGIAFFGVGCALLLAQSFAFWFASRLTSSARLEAPGPRRKLLERAARLQPGSSERALEVGLALRDTGELRAALRALERAVSLGGDVATFVALGNVALEAGEPRRARSAFDAALARSPGSVRAHLGLGEALRQLGELDGAERHLLVAAELLPGDLDVRARLDSLRVERFDRALELPPQKEPNLLGAPNVSR